MATNSLIKDLVSFFKAARHLWGRCPDCGTFFRLSDVAITSSPNPPKDWIRQLERQQAVLRKREEALDERDSDIDDRDSQLDDRESELENRADELDYTEGDLRRREMRLDKDAHIRVQEILRNKTELRSLIKMERKAAVTTSRATLLGKLLERLAPCLPTFSQYDPRDMRCICDPFDYVLFDGLTVQRHVKRIAFIEVKCGRSRLSSVQRSVLGAVENHKVHTEVWKIGDPDIPIAKQLSNGSSRIETPDGD
jgi:predicted Holliday junction resolvase-like endonuclease